MLSIAGLPSAQSPSRAMWPSIDPPCARSGATELGGRYVPSANYGSTTDLWHNELLTRGGWRGSVLGPTGDKVYGIPTNASTVLEIDPVERKVTTFGQLGEATTAQECSGKLNCGVEKWIGGVLAENGHIIGIPYAAESVV